jgi:AcrR family transcriptional regulator
MDDANGQPVMRWMRPPRQDRSSRSLHRLLDATAQILSEKRFAEMSVAEVVRRAGSSVGVFYSRFPSKLALLHHLDERFTAGAEESLRRALDPARWRGRTRAEAAAEIVRFLLEVHERERGLLRAVIVQVRAAPDERFQATGERLTHLVDRLADLLLALGPGDAPAAQQPADPRPEHACGAACDRCRDDGGRGAPPHPSPAVTAAERASVRLALVMLIATIRDVVVFGDTTFYPGLLGLTSADDLLAVLTRAFLQLLDLPGES